MPSGEFKHLLAAGFRTERVWGVARAAPIPGCAPQGLACSSAQAVCCPLRPTHTPNAATAPRSPHPKHIHQAGHSYRGLVPVLSRHLMHVANVPPCQLLITPPRARLAMRHRAAQMVAFVECDFTKVRTTARDGHWHRPHRGKAQGRLTGAMQAGLMPGQSRFNTREHKIFHFNLWAIKPPARLRSVWSI